LSGGRYRLAHRVGQLAPLPPPRPAPRAQTAVASHTRTAYTGAAHDHHDRVSRPTLRTPHPTKQKQQRQCIYADLLSTVTQLTLTVDSLKYLLP
jgi:hypothetical protein